MNIQEILNMVDEDIARAEEQQPDLSLIHI